MFKTNCKNCGEEITWGFHYWPIGDELKKYYDFPCNKCGCIHRWYPKKNWAVRCLWYKTVKQKVRIKKEAGRRR